MLRDPAGKRVFSKFGAETKSWLLERKDYCLVIFCAFFECVGQVVVFYYKSQGRMITCINLMKTLERSTNIQKINTVQHRKKWQQQVPFFLH